MKNKLWIWLCIIFMMAGCKPSSGQQKPTQLKEVIIIRHGEKPDEGDNLSCKGLNRSLQLPEVLNKKFGTPDYVFVPSINTGKSTSTARMYQTIVPFAVKYNLNVNTKYDVEDTRDLAQDILKRKGIVLVVWEHKNIDNIVRDLNVKDAPKWPNEDYDSIWIVTFQNGKPVLTTDKEGINPSGNCSW